MEKVPAACAMEWSIELEKGLRSKRPGRPVEVIEQIGAKLLKWSEESCITMSTSKMYGLVPGEERSFANTILLRLADAFKSGDNSMRACILKVFLLELRHIREKGRSYDGVLSKQRLPNYLELLRRVRLAFDAGDIRTRAFSLRLLGCWAPLTHDNAGVRYIILSSLRSDHVLEVKASLFASGCLCRISDDFSCIVLGILVDIICSVNVSSSAKLAAARAFGEIQCSSLVASRAYKTGKKLVQDSQLEDYTVAMLSSLSKLAAKAVILIPEQVEILLSFLAQECTPVIKRMVLKCIRFLHLRAFPHFPVNGNVFSTLFHKIDDPDLSLDLQCDVLKTLCQLISGLPKLSYVDIPEFPSLVMIVEHASRSPDISKRFLALGLLVDLSCKAKGERKGNGSFTEQLSTEFVSFQSQVSSENLFSVISDASLLARHVILLLINDISSMTKNMDVETERRTRFLEVAGFNESPYDLKQRYNILLNYILRLIGEYPTLGLVTLSRCRNLIEELVHFHSTFNTEAPCRHGDVSEMETDVAKPNQFFEFQEHDRGKYAQYVSEIVLRICSFAISCLNVLDDNSLAGFEVCSVVKLLVDCLQKVEFCNSDACEIVSFHMRSYLMFRCCGIKDNTMQLRGEPEVGVKLNLSEDDCLVDHERLAFGLARRMMKRKKYWMVYTAGKYSSSEGFWFAATYAFRKLIDEAKSDCCRYWLKSLMLMAGAESEMKLLLFPKLGVKLISELYTDSDCGKSCEDVREERTGDCDCGIAFMHDQLEKLARVHRRICSSQEIVPFGTLKGTFWFQHWFLSLRGKVLEILLDVLKHLDSHYQNGRKLDNYGPAKQNLGAFSSISAEDMIFLTSHFSSISFQLNELAREYDFLRSFMDMDFKSSRIISRLALCCSLLAFCTGFPLYYSGFSADESTTSNIRCFRNSLNLLLEDLSRRLFYMYGQSASNFERHMPLGGWLGGCLQSRKQISMLNQTDRGLIFVSRFAISGFHHLQQNAKEAKHKEDICGMFRKGMQLLCDILVKCMSFPFQAPQYFFKVRGCIGAELFVINGDVGNPGELCVLRGNQLCLNLCIQLRNISPEYHCRVSKIYCILAASSSGPVSEGNKKREREVFTGFQAQKIEEIVNLYQLLLSRMGNETKKYKLQGIPIYEVDLVTTYVHVEPNKQGQGFSTCLLDVSAFSEGEYQIKWHSCCVDKNDCHWSLPALNGAILFTVKRPATT